MVRASLLSVVLMGVASAAPLSSNAAPAPITLADLRAEIRFESVALAPDARHVALIERRANRDGTKQINTLVLIDTTTHGSATLVRDLPDVRGAQWSPAGDRIAFIATPRRDTLEPKAADPVPELFVVAASGGDPQRVSTTRTGVDAFSWRPDGRAFAYASEDQAPNKKAIDAHDDAFDIMDAAWNEREAKLPVHLYEIVAGRTARQLTRGRATLAGGFTYTHDGRALIFPQAPEPSNHYRAARLARVPCAGGPVIILAAANARSTDPRFAPSGAALAYATEHPQAPSQSEIVIAHEDGSHGVPISRRLDRNVDFVGFAPDGHSVLVRANDGVRSRLFDLTLDGRASTAAMRYADWDGNIAQTGSIARDGSTAFVADTSTSPPEVYVARVRASTPERVTHLNAALARHAFGKTSTVTWRSHDGFTADGVLTAPVHYREGRRYPLVLVIHGGPTATSTTGLDTLAQLLAARDFFVFQPNYRGSDNAGWRWAQATVPHITSAPGADVMEGLAAVLKHAAIDPKRIGVSGWSEGGLLTSWLITHDSRWKSAMSGAAVNDWTWYAAMTDAQDFSPSFIGPSPWTSARWRALYDAESPLTFANRVRTPTLIMSDVGDQRVPEPLAFAFYHEIRATGTPVKLLMIPVDGHFPRDPARSAMVLGRWVDWFAATL